MDETRHEVDRNPVTVPISEVADFEEYEAQVEAQGGDEQAPPPPQLILQSLADAQRAAARVAYLRKQADELAAVYDAEEQELLQKLEALRQRKAEALKPYERRMSWYLFALEQFHRAQLARDPKAKTIRLPAGDLTIKAQQPQWNYGDEKATAMQLRDRCPSVVRMEPVLDKWALKKVAVVQDGKVYVPDENGELVETDITVTLRPPKFEFKPA